MSTELPIGVCTWCIDRRNPLRGIEVAGRELGLRCAQVGFFSERAVRSADAASIVEAARSAGVTLVGAFVAFESEDYASIARIAETGGFMPDDTYAPRLAIIRAVIDVAAAMKVQSLSVHAGTVPSEVNSLAYRKLLDRVREVADHAAERELRLLLETGREPAGALLGIKGVRMIFRGIKGVRMIFRSPGGVVDKILISRPASKNHPDTFLGRPLGRRVTSSPRRVAMRDFQRSVPRGVPRTTDCRTAFVYSAAIGRLTQATQSRGGSTGHELSHHFAAPLPFRRDQRLLHRQSSARLTSAARKALAST